jgi:hypothetical protein
LEIGLLLEQITEELGQLRQVIQSRGFDTEIMAWPIYLTPAGSKQHASDEISGRICDPTR